MIYLDFFNKDTLKEISKDYKYIIKANDNFLSGWGASTNKKHIQLILAKDEQEKERILHRLYTDNTFNYINWYPLNNKWYNNILALRNRYHYTLRNDF